MLHAQSLALLYLLFTATVVAPLFGDAPGDAAVEAPAEAPRAAPAENVRFDRWGVEDGLPGSTINDLLQGPRGFLWIATNDGLGRFDGRRFLHYRHDPLDPTSLGASSIRAIFAERDGDLWLALGVGGLDFLDRKTGVFHHFSTDGRTPSTFLEDRDGTVWVGTGAGFFHRFRDGEALEPLRLPTPSGVGGPLITALLEDRDGRVFVATCGGGLLVREDAESFRKIDLGSVTPQASDDLFFGRAGDAGDCIYDLVEAPQGGLWIGTAEHGLIFLPPSTQANAEPVRFCTQCERKLAGDTVHQIAASEGQVWFAFPRRGIARIDRRGEDFEIRHYSGDEYPGFQRAVFLHVDRADNRWIGTRQGLYRHRPGDDSFEHFQRRADDPHSLSSDALVNFCEDRSGALWIGTAGNGLNLYAPSRWKFRAYHRSLQDSRGPISDLAQTFVEDPAGGVWIGTPRGLQRLDPEQETFDTFQADPDDPLSLANNQVSALEIDRRGLLWAATNSGLQYFDPNRRTFHHPPSWRPDQIRRFSNPTLLEASRDGALWVGTSARGVFRYDPAADRVGRLPLSFVDADRSLTSIQALYEDRDGNLWVGLISSGLVRRDAETGELEHFTQGDGSGLNNRTVNTFYQDRSGRLWIGTYSGGLSLWHPETRTFTAMTVRDGLPNHKIHGIVEDDRGRLWITTQSGLARYDPSSGVLRVYDRRDGLADDEFVRGAILRTREQEIFVGGMHGWSRFHPERLNDNPYIPPIVVASLRTAHRELGEPELSRGVVEIADDEKFFILEPAALDFAEASKTRYSWQLEGFDTEWYESETRGRIGRASEQTAATYTNLDPGEYTFRVRGSNNDGVWNREGAELTIRVLPPWWRTWWFYSLQALLALAVLIGAFVVQRRRLLGRQQAELERRELARKTEELEHARRMQLSMLPLGDLRSPSFEAVGRMRTASEVGGDYYDFFDLGDECYCVAVGDAVGHGSAAGLLVGMVKSSLTQALRHGREAPDDLLRDLNQVLRLSLTQRQAAMGLGLMIFNARDRFARLSSLAMPPPYHYSAVDQGLQSIEMVGLPLGVRDQIEIQACERLLAPNDLLIAVSDGFPERLDRFGEPWGFDAMERALAEICRRERTPEAVAQALIAACDAHADGFEPEDDMTVVVVRAAADPSAD